MEIGPQLPPHLASKLLNDNNHNDVRDDVCCSQEINPKSNANAGGDEVDADDGGVYGPALPQGFKPRSTAIIGPCRPDVLHEENLKTDRKTNSDSDDDDQESELHTIGPKLPTKNEEDEYLIRRKAEIESRARSKKDDLCDNKDNKTKKIEREEWMTELPPELGKNFGLGPRTFRSKNVDLGDRSGWTDTPSDRESKKSKPKSKEPERREKSKKEVDMEKYVSTHNKRHRSESLLDIHQKDKKKKQKTDGGSSSERRPFDRDTDLGAGQLDAAKRKSLIKQSAHLNSKFHHSKQGPTYL